MKALIEDICKDAKYGFLDPFHSIPFTQTRKLSKYGADKLITIYVKAAKVEGNDHSVVHPLRLDTRIVIPLTCTYFFMCVHSLPVLDVPEEHLEESVKAVPV